MTFADRVAAGRALAELARGRVPGDVVVLGLPRGGVPVAAEVARSLGAPLDVLVVRKLGLPHHPELAMGAIGEDGVRVLDRDLVARERVSDRALAAVEARERAELTRRTVQYRGDRPRVPIAGRTVLIVDDGLATGSTARRGARGAGAGARRVVLAVPVAPPDTVAMLRREADDVLAVLTPERFAAVGQWYDDFAPTSDAEVVAALVGASGSDATRSDARPVGRAGARPAVRAEVVIPVGGVALAGFLDVPDPAEGIVVFVHGSGSSRHSRRNQAVARHLNEHGLATLLFDLLTDDESGNRRLVFDIPVLTSRLEAVIGWLGRRSELAGLPLGLFGASTGAAAALRAAAHPATPVRSVVSRGGRPDLAGDALEAVSCPVLLIVGGADGPTLAVNADAARHLLRAPHRTEIVPGGTHLFEEPGALEAVARLAARWFEQTLVEAVQHVPPRGRGAS